MYRAGTLKDAREGAPLSFRELDALKKALGEPPDIAQLPGGKVDKILGDLAGAITRGAMAPGSAVASQKPITSEDLLAPAQDLSTSYLAGTSPLREAIKNAAASAWSTLKPGQMIAPDTPAEPPRFSGAGGNRFDEAFSAFQQPPADAGPGGGVTGAQQGPTMPSWQASINPAYRTPELISAIEAEAARRSVPPEAIVAVAGVEGSNWNPRYMTNSQAGIFQIAPGDFRTAGGTLGGLTYDQYRNATPAQQVRAYSDYIASSPNAAYLDYASGDPALAAAILQGIQFSPQSEEFTKQFLAGNTGYQIAHDPKGRAPFYTGQADDLRYTTIDDMRNAFARRIAGWPQSGALPGGR